MICEASGKTMHVSDYDILVRYTKCSVCGKRVKITLPNKKLYGNVAKLNKHTIEK